ncbi:RNA-editing ligase 2, mitochondrial [Hydra vulgaris]|uniref:RNA-editing ligase 2, mitochondrial n=1 Tax=Hydra vulgaris TaxID=6087 RepID=UPI001F5E997A|nr:RNA-editing ligase 2, mitochondrial [Hydra vulgaris]
MIFEEYEKMADSINKFIGSSELEKTSWIVLEKIHGANFSFHTDGEWVQIGRRRDFLMEGENFFNHITASFMNDYPEKMKTIYRMVETSTGKQIKQVSIYGELFGGYYSNVPTNGNQKPIQKEIQYCPDVRWCAFDIGYRTQFEEGLNEYLDPDVAMEIFKSLDIFYLQPLMIGTMSQALNFKLGFDSTIPKLLGLPPLPAGSNKAEGVVVKPIKTLKCPTRRGGEVERVIIKIKLPEFEEERKQTLPKATKPVSKSKKDIVLQRILANATPQRLTNAISKIGFPDKENQKLIINEFKTDIFTDLFANDVEAHQLWESLEEKQREIIENVLNQKTSSLLKQYILNMNK